MTGAKTGSWWGRGGEQRPRGSLGTIWADVSANATAKRGQLPGQVTYRQSGDPSVLTL